LHRNGHDGLVGFILNQLLIQISWNVCPQLIVFALSFFKPSKHIIHFGDSSLLLLLLLLSIIIFIELFWICLVGVGETKNSTKHQ